MLTCWELKISNKLPMLIYGTWKERTKILSWLRDFRETFKTTRFITIDVTNSFWLDWENISWEIQVIMKYSVNTEEIKILYLVYVVKQKYINENRFFGYVDIIHYVLRRLRYKKKNLGRHKLILSKVINLNQIYSIFTQKQKII